MLQRRQFLKFSPSRSEAFEDYRLHVSRPVMACRFEVILPVRERAGVSVAQKGLDEAERLERQLTIFKEASEVSLINRNAASRAVSVTPSLFELLRLSISLYRETEGAFDITSGPLSRCWGFFKRQGRIPEPGEIEEAMAIVGSDKLLLDGESRSVRFLRHGVSINLGSIGKGYALDRIKAKMRTRLRSALLSAGSSSMCAIGEGDHGHNGWLVGIRHPGDKKRRVAILKLRDASMATSGYEEQHFEDGGRRYGHIIDPRSGVPAQGVAGVTVVTGSAAVADALATAFYVGGRELAERYCSTHPQVLAIMLEADSYCPVIFGNNDTCDVEVISE